MNDNRVLATTLALVAGSAGAAAVSMLIRPRQDHEIVHIPIDRPQEATLPLAEPPPTHGPDLLVTVSNLEVAYSV